MLLFLLMRLGDSNTFLEDVSLILFGVDMDKSAWRQRTLVGRTGNADERSGDRGHASWNSCLSRAGMLSGSLASLDKALSLIRTSTSKPNFHTIDVMLTISYSQGDSKRRNQFPKPQ